MMVLDGGGGGGRTGAVHWASVPPFDPRQDQFQGPEPDTDVAVPAVHKLIVGVDETATPSAVPHAPLTTVGGGGGVVQSIGDAYGAGNTLEGAGSGKAVDAVGAGAVGFVVSGAATAVGFVIGASVGVVPNGGHCPDAGVAFARNNTDKATNRIFIARIPSIAFQCPRDRLSPRTLWLSIWFRRQ